MPSPRALILILIALTGCATHRAVETFRDIPKLDNIHIDGKGDTWGDRGYRVDAFAQSSINIRPEKDFAAHLRLGWNDTGLLVLLHVTDPHDNESASTDSLYEGECVELFMAPIVGARDVWQLLIAPGVSDKFPELRTNLYDSRKDTDLKKTPLEAQVQRIKTADGYQIEALMPWKNLGITPEVGREIGFQIYVDDVPEKDAEPNHASWYPKLGANRNTKLMQSVRLADRTSPPAAPVAWGGYEKFHNARINVLAGQDWEGGKVEIYTAGNDNVYAAGKLKREGDRATASLTLPMPPPGNPYPPLSVAIDGQPTATVDLGDPEIGRADTIVRQTNRFEPTVFYGNKLPTLDFADAVFARDLIGPYAIKTTFYDAHLNKVESAEAAGRYGAIVEVATEDGKTFRRFVTLCRVPLAPSAAPDPEGLVNAYVAPALRDHFSKEIAEMLKKPNAQSSMAIWLAALGELPADEKREFTDHWNPTMIDEQYWFNLQKKTDTLEPYRYLSWLPAGYDAAPQKKWPLLIVLHGSGGRGDDLEVLRKRHEVPTNLVSDLQTLPFVVIGPQCPRGDWWRSPMLVDLIDRVQEKYRVDPDRIYVIGFSMGGYGTWDLAETIPQRLAAVAPAAGGADPADAVVLKDLPIWIWHGDHDGSVKFDYSTKMFAALSVMGARTRFTIVQGGVHENDTAYQPELYRWLLEQKRGAPTQGPTTQPMIMQPLN